MRNWYAGSLLVNSAIIYDVTLYVRQTHVTKRSPKRVLVLILSYENEISFTCKLNSFSYEWVCTRPRFERKALGNSEMVYSNVQIQAYDTL